MNRGWFSMTQPETQGRIKAEFGTSKGFTAGLSLRHHESA